MATYPAESFYRGTIRQSIANNTSVPFTLKVSKIPTLTSWLLTVSPNTANEEIIEYSGVDGTALTITVIKRGINPSTQTLTVDWTDYNNATYQKAHSQNDTIRGDVNHLHIIQDYGTLNSTKLDKSWGLRDTMGASRWSLEIDATWAEVKKAIIDWTTISPSETLRKRKADWTYEEIPYSTLQADMALAWGGSYTITPYESGIVIGDAVALLKDWLFKCTSSNKSSTNITSSAITGFHWQVEVSSWKYVFFYSVWVNLFVRVWTLVWDVITYWTEIAVDSLTTANCTWWIAKMWTDKFVVVYADANTASIARHMAWTISGTTITLGSVQTQTHAAWYACTVSHVTRVRDDAYVAIYQSLNNYIARIHTISWTTITINTTTSIWSYNNNYWGVNVVYLSDNLVWLTYSYYNGSAYVAPVYIFAITPWWTTAATTYSWTLWHWTTYVQPYISRYWTDSYVMTLSWVNTNTFLIPKPAAWTTITIQTLFDNGASKFLPTLEVFDNVFATIDGTTLKVYQEATSLWTIAWITIYWLSTYQYSQQQFSWARQVYIAWTNWTLRTINFANVFYIWFANSTTWWTTMRWVITKTWVIAWSIYYLQSDGTIAIYKTNTRVWIWVWTNLLFI